MRRWIAVPAALVLLALMLTACGSSSSSDSSEESSTSDTTEATTEEAGGGGGGSDFKVTYVSPVAAQPGQQFVAQGVEDGAKELGGSANVLDAALSPDKQVSAVETAINSGDTAITSWTLDPNAAGGAYEKAQAKGIPVIGMNSKGIGVTGTVWWETQLCEPGGPQDVSAEKIAEIHPHAKTILIEFLGAESTKALSDCFAKAAKEHGLEVINETNNEADTAAGSQKVFEPLLTKYPEVEAIWDYNDESALGVSAALLAAGKTIATTDNPDGIVVTGQNGDKGAIEAVEEGRISWTWDPNNLASGWAAVNVMNEAIETGKAKDVVVEAKLIDSETIGEYVPPDEQEYTLKTLPIKK